MPVPPQAKADGSGAKNEGIVLAACKEMPWTAAERGCLASVAGEVERCEASIGQERLQAIFENVRAKMKGPDQPAPSDVAAPERSYIDRFERARSKQQQRLDRVQEKAGKAAPPPVAPVATAPRAVEKPAEKPAAPVATAPLVTPPSVEADLPRVPR